MTNLLHTQYGVRRLQGYRTLEVSQKLLGMFANVKQCGYFEDLSEHCEERTQETTELVNTC